MPKQKGFTLIELLVVIAIITVLAVMGFTAFRGIKSSANDPRRKIDITAISRAYEARFSGGKYPITGLQSSDFASGSLPRDPDSNKGDYYNVVANDGSWFKICASLESNSYQYCNSSSYNCSCVTSSQGGVVSSSTGYSGTGSGIGLGGVDHPLTCDPSQTLGSGLIAFWKFDENSWNGTSGEVKDVLGINHGTSFNGASITTHTPDTLNFFKNAGNFDGSNDYVDFGNPAIFSPGTNSFTRSIWMKKSAIATTSEQILMDQETSGGGGNRLVFWIPGTSQSNTGKINFQYQGGGTAVATSLNRVDDGVWHLIVGTFTGAPSPTIQLFVDNNSGISVSAAGGSISFTGPLRVSQRSGLTGSYYSGQADDVRIYNRALTAAEVSSLYNTGAGCIP